MLEACPYGYYGPGDLSSDDQGFIELMMRRLTNIKQTSGIDSLHMVRALPDGGVAMAIDKGGIRKMIVKKPAHEDSVSQDESVPLDAPMLFSGRVIKSVLRGNEKPRIRLTRQTQKRLRGYQDQAPNGVSDAPEQSLERFNIPYGFRFDEFNPKLAGNVSHTQYAQLRSTWYSGAMAEVVQIVGGYGKSKFDRKPSDKTELVKMPIPNRVMEKSKAEMAKYQMYFYSGTPPKDGEIKYDYKYHECHAVAFGEDRKPWILRINRSGVYAAPLPMIPITTARAFRDWIEEVGDDEILWALDRFGGLPSGEPLPSTNSALKAWERAGVIIKLCDTADFYSHMTYSSAMGWSFNLKGTEGYNTCYDYDEEQGFAYGLMFSMRVRIGETKKITKVRPSDSELAYQSVVAKYLSDLIARSRRDRDGGAAIRYKLRAANFSDILERAKLYSGQSGASLESEYSYWSEKQLDPIASANGNMTQVSRGWLHHPAKWEFQPQIKFPEPLLGYCVSFDFRPTIVGKGKEGVKCDTPMFAYYLGDDLHVAKYFRDPRKTVPKIETDFHDCMTVGSWTQYEHTEGGIQGHFYTTAIDDRKSFGDSIKTTKIVGKDLGFSAVPGFVFDDLFARPGTLFRKRYYTHKINVSEESAKSRSIALCIPFYSRNALLHARKDESQKNGDTEIFRLEWVSDPTTYRYWTNDFIFAWVGSLERMTGKPQPKDGSPVWVEIEQYNPGPCTDFADAGSWISGLPADYTWLIHPERNVWHHSKDDVAPAIAPYVKVDPPTTKEERRLDASMIASASHVARSNVDGHYFAPSPSNTGAKFLRLVSKNVAGDTELAVVDEPFGSATWFGYSRLFDGQDIPCFIGVINE